MNWPLTKPRLSNPKELCLHVEGLALCMSHGHRMVLKPENMPDHPSPTCAVSPLIFLFSAFWRFLQLLQSLVFPVVFFCNGNNVIFSLC